jgi:hypothetical protein
MHMKTSRFLLGIGAIAALVAGAGCSLSPTPVVSTPDVGVPSTGKIAAREVVMTGCSPKAMTVQEPAANTAVSFPLTVKARVHNAASPNCRWTLFEAQAGVMTVKNADGEVIAQAPLATQEDWMTDQEVGFESVINLMPGKTASGPLMLVITEEDPSGQGLSETIEIPIFVAADNI